MALLSVNSRIHLLREHGILGDLAVEKEQRSVSSSLDLYRGSVGSFIMVTRPPSANKLDSSTSIALILDHRLAAFLYLPRFNPFCSLEAPTRFVFQCRLLVTPSFNQTNSGHDNMSSAILDVDAAPLQVRAPQTPTPTHKETRCGQQHHPRPHLSRELFQDHPRLGRDSPPWIPNANAPRFGCFPHP